MVRRPPPLEGDGFELPVPRDDARLLGRSLRAQRVETDAAKREFGSGSCLFAPPWGQEWWASAAVCAFRFPTPGNGQQESRLAPIGRHLRLLRRGVLRTGCFPRQAAFSKGGHEIDDGWRGPRSPWV